MRDLIRLAVVPFPLAVTARLATVTRAGVVSVALVDPNKRWQEFL